MNSKNNPKRIEKIDFILDELKTQIISVDPKKKVTLYAKLVELYIKGCGIESKFVQAKKMSSGKPKFSFAEEINLE